jgi:hypothetical protein
MLTPEQLKSLPVNGTALKMVPESIARGSDVLAVDFHEGELRLILPELSTQDEQRLIDKLNFVLETTISWDVASVDHLRPMIDFYYTAIYSQIQNCDAAFVGSCPNMWIELEPTHDVNVRHCDVCQQNVTFCCTSDRLRQLLIAGKRTAYIDPSTLVDGNVGIY